MAYEELNKISKLIKLGEKLQAYNALVDLLKKEPDNEYAWGLLSRVLSIKSKKIYCLQQVLRINPNNSDAKFELEKLKNEVSQLPIGEAKALSASTYKPEYAFDVNQFRPRYSKGSENLLAQDQHVTKLDTSDFSNLDKGSKISIFVIIGLIIIIASLLVYGKISQLPNDPSSRYYIAKPNDAFSTVTRYALNDMVAGHAENYWGCGAEDAYGFYNINVKSVSSNVYYVIGATKAINQYCVYDISYFYATVKYDSTLRKWKLLGNVQFSNPCVTTEAKYGECTTTQWRYYWKPDPDWRP